jgi:hypothetical protein
MTRSDDELFFAQDSLRNYLDHRRHAAIDDIARFDGNRLLNSNVEDLTKYFVDKYSANAPEIINDQISADQRETQVDVTGHFEYGGWPGETTIVPGTELTLHVPMNGEIELIRLAASTMSGAPPRGRINRNEVVLTFLAPSDKSVEAKAYFDSQLQGLREHLAWTQQDLDEFNRSLPRTLRSEIDARRQRLLANQNTIASLGYPLRSKPNAPRTYALPEVRRKAAPQPPAASTAPYLPEPALDDQTYEQILTILGNMVRVMEQSPEAFSTMGEQDLRTHFLVQLNGQFEGRAGGETFHGSGKTDILLQERDRSVFIAECKFWIGPASLTAAIDQLLDYATWRDAKGAILIFSRNADFSGVVSQIPGLISAHPQVRGDVRALSETVFRFRLRQRDDSSRDLIATCLLYNVPVARTTSERLKPRPGRADSSDAPSRRQSNDR